MTLVKSKYMGDISDIGRKQIYGGISVTSVESKYMGDISDIGREQIYGGYQ